MPSALEHPIPNGSHSAWAFADAVAAPSRGSPAKDPCPWPCRSSSAWWPWPFVWLLLDPPNPRKDTTCMPPSLGKIDGGKKSQGIERGKDSDRYLSPQPPKADCSAAPWHVETHRPFPAWNMWGVFVEGTPFRDTKGYPASFGALFGKQTHTERCFFK